MLFTANQTVMHGRQRYEPGQVIPSDLGAYFAANGWADAGDDEARALLSRLRGDAMPDAVLQINDVQLGVTAPEVSNG